MQEFPVDGRPSLEHMRSTVAEYREEIDKADADPIGIANAIYKIGMKIGGGRAIAAVDTVCDLLEQYSPQKKWHKSRQSECRTLIRRYWEIPEAREALSQANEPAPYHSVLSVLRITAKGHSVKSAVRAFRTKRARKRARPNLNRLLTRIGETAASAGYSLVEYRAVDDQLALTLRQTAQLGRRRTKSN
jgi:type I site-specific restriction endonuclease